MYIMAEPTNKKLYEKVKKQADKKFDKPSAYKSGWIVKQYKSLGGNYKGKKTNKLKKAISLINK